MRATELFLFCSFFSTNNDIYHNAPFVLCPNLPVGLSRRHCSNMESEVGWHTVKWLACGINSSSCWYFWFFRLNLGVTSSHRSGQLTSLSLRQWGDRSKILVLDSLAISCMQSYMKSALKLWELLQRPCNPESLFTAPGLSLVCPASPRLGKSAPRSLGL